MAKHFITLIVLIMMAGCIFEIDSGKGNLNFAIEWPKKNATTRAIPENCEKILITITKYNSANYETISKEVIRKPGETQVNVKIEDISTGKWEIMINAYDSKSNTIANIFEIIDIKDGENSIDAIFGLPNKVYYMMPSSGSAVTTDSNSVLTWNSVKSNYITTAPAVLDKMSYTVYYGETDELNDSNIINKDIPITSTMQGVYLSCSNIPKFEAGKTYYWKVKSTNSEGSVDSPTVSFRVRNMVAPPVNISPSGIVVAGSLNEFKWQVASDLEKDNKYQIILQRIPVAGGLPESKTFPNSGNITGTTYTLSTVEKSWFIYGYVYFWHVVINDINGETNGITTSFNISQN